MKKNLIIFSLSLMLVGCGMNIEKKPLSTQGGTGTGTGTGSGATATFKSVQEQIINVSCIRCHKPGGKASGWPFTTYDEVIASGGIASKNPDSSDFYNDIVTGNMPQGAAKLDASLIAMVREWILAGALNN